MKYPRFKKQALILSALFLFFGSAFSQSRVRQPFRVPAVPGYVVMKCDFHMHTVFSDGVVWPSVRVDEAWAGGLDAIAITDHLEYVPHEADIRRDNNRPFEIAAGEAAGWELLVIRGAEITRKMPPGHFNAIFIKDANRLRVDDWRKSMEEAAAQGGFLFWNHPGWNGQQPDGVSRWYPEHTELLEKGLMQGIEIVNEKEYYPQVHAWCLEKNLTMLANSDMHDPVQSVYNAAAGDPRPMTWVLAKTADEAGIKEGLISHRTVCYWKGNLIGREEFLKPIFTGGFLTQKDTITVRGDGWAGIPVLNDTDVDLRLSLNGEVDGISVPRTLTCPANKIVHLSVQGKAGHGAGERVVRIPYMVDNFWVAPGKGLAVEIPVYCKFIK
jgi:3',5'-nucleoside bisphosphate phosphatase